MIDRITVGAAFLMGALAAGTGLIRWAVAPPRARGRHRAPTFIEVPLAHLMPAWPEPVHGAVAVQAFAYCVGCRAEAAVVVHPDGAHRCDRGHVTITGGAS